MFAKWKRLKDSKKNKLGCPAIRGYYLYLESILEMYYIHYLRICFQLCDIKFPPPICFFILNNNFTPISAHFPNTITKRLVLILYIFHKINILHMAKKNFKKDFGQ